jgi:hypothetical protein
MSKEMKGVIALSIIIAILWTVALYLNNTGKLKPVIYLDGKECTKEK